MYKCQSWCDFPRQMFIWWCRLRWLMSLAWSTLGLTYPSFFWSTFMSHCRYVHVTVDASMHWLKFSFIGQRLLYEDENPFLTLPDEGWCKFLPTDSDTQRVSRAGPYRSFISLQNFSFRMRTCHVRCVYAFFDVDYHWTLFLAWSIEALAYGSFHWKSTM